MGDLPSSMRKIILAIFAVLSAVTVQSASLNADSIKSIFSDRRLAGIEGVWQFPSDGAIVLITRSSASIFDVVMVDSPNLNSVNGKKIGNLTITAFDNKFDAKFENKSLFNKDINASHAVITLTQDDALKIEPYTTGKKVNLRRWIPYLYRVIEDNNTRPKGLDCARRLYPTNGNCYKPCL